MPQDDIIVQVFEILENMIRTDPESSLIYISTWNKRQVDVKQKITLHFVKEGKILLKAIKSCLKDQMFEEYTNTRTVNSSAGQHWKNTTYHLANTAWDLTSKDIGRNSQAVRIIFNKLCITWNISRYSKK